MRWVDGVEEQESQGTGTGVRAGSAPGERDWSTLADLSARAERFKAQLTDWRFYAMISHLDRRSELVFSPGPTHNQNWGVLFSSDLEGRAWLGVSCSASGLGATLTTTTTTCWQELWLCAKEAWPEVADPN